MSIRAWALGLSLASLVPVAASCTTTYVDCDVVIRRCRTVCDTACDYYGCYPVCWDDCWDECRNAPREPLPEVPPPPADAGAPLPTVDAGAPAPGDGGPGGEGVLCSACSTNQDCQSDALCIQRGGADAGAGFCSVTCTATSGCPEGFTCTQVGSRKQCLPLGGTCR